MTEEPESVFVSYAKPDRAWAKWVAWHLREAGHPVELDVWNWSAGDDFIQRMSDAVARAAVVVALFSDQYFGQDRWTREERNAVAARRGRLVPLVTEPLTVDIPAHFAPLIRIDLYGLGEPAAARALLDAVNGPSADIDRPAFPPNALSGQISGSTPTFPGSLAPGHPESSDSSDRPEVWEVSVGRTPYFTGREAVIAQVREGLRGGRFILRGLGGIGKTQIALEYAHRFVSQYDIVWWIDAEQADQLPVHYIELATRLGIAKRDAGAEHNTRALLDYLRTHDRWLIILDNAENPEQLHALLPTGPGHVLITSRNSGWEGNTPDHNLDVFTRDESTAYLTARLPGITSQQADALASDLGNLPLALAQAAGTLATGVSLDRYRQLLAGKTRELLARGRPAEYSSPLAATVTIAAKRLADDSPTAAALLRLGAFLGPDPIPTAWLENAGPQLATVTVDPDEILWPQRDLQALARFGLARLGYGTFQIHRLTQAILRDHTPTADRMEINTDVSTTLATASPGEPNTPASWPQWAALTAHLTALQHTTIEHPELRQTALQAIHYLINSGQPYSAHELATSLHATWSSTHGQDHPDVLSCTQLLSQSVGNLGDYAEAKRITEDILERRRRILGEDHPDTLESALLLGGTLYNLGEYGEARRIAEDTFERRRRILGEDHPDTLESEHSLGATLHSLGEYGEARRIIEDTLERRRRILGEDHPDTLESAHSRSVTLHNLGKYAEDRRITEDTFERRRRILGEDHPDTLSSAHSLGTTLHSLGEYGEARRIAEDTFERRRRILGENHPGTLRSAHSLGTTLHSLGEYGEARRIAEDTFERRRRILGENHPDTLESEHFLGTTLHSLDEYGEARHIIEDTLERRRRTLGENHRETLRSTHSLGATLHSLGEYEEARRIIEDTLERNRRTLGENHIDTLYSAHLLSATLNSLRRYAEAEALLRDARIRSLRIFEADHPLSKALTASLASVLINRGKAREAHKLQGGRKAGKRRFDRK